MMLLLGKLKGWLIAGVVFMGVLAASYLKGQSDAKAKARERALKTKLKINEKLDDKRKQNEADHNDATKKAKMGKWFGFNRKPDSMRDDKR